MFIPLYDSNYLRHIRFQYVTLALIVLNVAVYLVTYMQSPQVSWAEILGLGYIPAVAFDYQQLPPGIAIVPESVTYVTYAFLHGDFFHIAGNMLFLWVFGDNVEDALGHVKYLLFYLLCAVAGAAFHGLVNPQSTTPLIGASGAIAGVIAAYLILHPRVKVWVLAFARIPLRVPAYIVLVIWIGLQVVMFFAGGENRVSFAAHIGGILAGAVLVVLLKRRDVPLFDRELLPPPQIDTPVVAEQPPTGQWGRGPA